MKTTAGKFVLTAAAAAIAAGCVSTGELAKEEATYPKDRVDARAVFAENCARCHGKDGRAHTLHGWLVGAQNFTNAKWRAETSTNEIIHAIKTGPGFMPAFGDKLSEAEIEALAAYVQSFAPAK